VRPPYVALCGPADADAAVERTAERVGRLVAERGWVLVTGGLGGAMAAAARGAAEMGGTVVALLPGSDRAAASPGHTVAIATGMGEMRNALLVRTVDAVIAVGGSWGTLSEIALAARTGVPVFSVESFDLPGDGVVACTDADDAVARVAGELG